MPEKFRPLFVTGAACSGSTFLGMMLSAHREITVACDPYFPLFKSLRRAMVRQSPEAPAFDPNLPFQDYYFSRPGLSLMDLIQGGELNLPFAQGDWPELYQASKARARHECPDLLPELARLLAPTYKEMFDQALGIIARVRQTGESAWVGMKEVWVVELFRTLARAYPEARFIILLRDPRAVLASMLEVGRRDPSQLAHALSYTRHCRKYFAFAVQYSIDPVFSGRLHLMTFEQLVYEPERQAREICDFLEVEPDPLMLEPGCYYNYATGSVWRPNTAFDTNATGLSIAEAESWREKLDRDALKMVDFICGPEMQLAGYQPLTEKDEDWPYTGILKYLISQNQGKVSWRSDFGDPQVDFGFELFRRSLLTLGDSGAEPDLIRRSFLFTEVYDRLRQVPRAMII